MSETNTNSTGIIPPAPNNENVFQNVNVNANGNAASANANLANANAANAASANANLANAASANANSPISNSSANVNTPLENDIATGESIATEESMDVATAEPKPIATAKSGKALSAKQSDLQRLRAETLDDMRSKYAERFSNKSIYPKPPKAKVYHASGLTTIRQRDGEAAYESALNNIMDKNDPAMGRNGKSQMSMTRKKPVPSLNTGRTNTARANTGRTSIATANTGPLNNSNKGRSAIIDSIETMGKTVKGMIDTMVQASKALTKELKSKQAARPIAPLTNMTRRRNTNMYRNTRNSRMSPVYENNNNYSPYRN